MTTKKTFAKRLGVILSWLGAGLPLLACAAVHIGLIVAFRYTTFDFSATGMYLIMMLISLAPTLVYVPCWLAWFRWGKRSGLKWVLVVICVLYTPISLLVQSFMGWASPFYSETSNTAHYLKVDEYVEEVSKTLHDFFPDDTRPEEYYYRYMYCIDPNFEIYAEWTLSLEEIEAEKQRISALFDAQKDIYTVETMQQGAFTCVCLLRPSYANPFTLHGDNQYYEHTIFAFDEQTGRVRYIHNDGVDVPEDCQPRCFSLDW